MPRMVDVTCWRVYGWSRGRWTLRSTHDTAADAAEHAEALCHKSRIRTKVQECKTRRAMAQEPSAPTAAQRFREQQFDQMVIRRQAFAYYKSGSNGTELLDTSGLENS